MPLTLEVYLAFLGVVVVWIAWPLLIGAGWVPTPRKVVRRMLHLAEVGPGDTLFELGSGDGRILYIAAREFGARAVGIEADPLRVLWTLVLIRLLGLRGRVSVLWGNFFKKDLGAASVVTVYQGKSINNRLRDKFLGELRTGTRVVSYAFTFDGWDPERVDEESQIYLYII